MQLELVHIEKYYGNHQAIYDLNIKFDPGVYGFLGANGAGKSTLLKILSGNLTPSSGEIRVNRQSYKILSEDYFNHLGYLPQGFGYYPNLTAIEFLDFMAAIKGICKKLKQKQIHEVLSQVGLQDVAHKKIKTFSGGMKQRLGIAQALLNDPQVLILDEPTAGLDLKERIRLKGVLSSLSKNKIIIIATHIVSDIESIADHIVLFNKGKIHKMGTIKQVVESINGKVWHGSVSYQESLQMVDTFCISHQRQYHDEVQLRIISKTQPFQQFINVKPNLEDVYLYMSQFETSVVER